MLGTGNSFIDHVVFSELNAFAYELVRPQHWQSLFNSIQFALFGNLFATLLTLMTFLFGFACYQRLLWFSDRTVKLAIRDEHISSLNSSRLFLSTVTAAWLCWSPLLALGIYLRWRAANSISPDIQSALGAGLIAVFAMSVTFRLMQEFFSQGGLSEAIYRLQYSTARYVLNRIELTVLLITPLIFMFVFVSSFADGRWYDSVGRISFLLMTLLCFRQFHQFCWPGSKFYQRLEHDEATAQSGWYRHRIAIYVFGAILFLLASGLTISGWFELARELSIKLSLTMFLGIVGFSIRTVVGQKANELIRQTHLIEALGRTSDSLPTVRSPRVQEFVRRYSRTANRGVGFLAMVSFLAVAYWIWADWIVIPPELLKIRIGGVALAGLVGLAKLLGIGLVTYYLARELPVFAMWCFSHQSKIEIKSPDLVSKLIAAVIVYGGLWLAARSIELEWPVIPWLGTLLAMSVLYAARNFVSDGFAGGVLMFDSRVRVGDSLEVAGSFGRVEQVNWFTTVIEDNHGTRQIVPNSLIINQRLVKTRDQEAIPLLIDVSIPRDSDAYQAQALMMLVAQRDPATVLQPPPYVRFVGFRTNELRFQIRLLVLASQDFAATRQRMEEKLELELERHEIVLESGLGSSNARPRELANGKAS